MSMILMLTKFKLLLGEQLAPRWHWGLIFSMSKRLVDAQIGKRLQPSGQYTLIDEKWSAGLEKNLERTSEPTSMQTATEF